MRRAVFERVRALDARLARRYGEIDELPSPEQAQVAICRRKRVPFEPRLGDKNFTLVETGCTGRGADLVARLDGEQGLVTVYDVDRGKAPGEMRCELSRTELHR